MANPALTNDDLREMFRLMLMGRRFTERAVELALADEIPTGLHPSAGQEAVGVGACYGLRPDDWVIPSLRTTEAFWTRGVTLLQMMNAMMANAGSISKGKESFHHSGYPDHGIVAGSAIVAAHIPVAVGAAMGLRWRGSDAVVVCFFGDGASARGDFHEGFNMAAVLKAPVVFVCENNLYFQTAAAAAGTPIEDIADRAPGYGIPGVIVDGQDVLAVHEATAEAVARARHGEGPSMVECKTYRFMGHYPTVLREERPPEEIEEWKSRDPVSILGERLKADGVLDEGAVAELERQIGGDLQEAIEQAKATPQPTREDAYSNVYKGAIEEMGL